jgi:Glycosyltransferase 61
LRLAAFLSTEPETRSDLSVAEIPHRGRLELRPPHIALSESGQRQSLPAQMPARSAAPLYFATLADSVVAVSDPTRRCYLLSSREELVVDSIDDSPNVARRAAKDWGSFEQSAKPRLAGASEVILAAGQRHGYWHWWVDVLPRIWLLHRHGPPEASSLPIAFPPFASSFQRDSLEMLGLLPRVETIQPGLWRFESVAFTPGLTTGGSRFPSDLLSDYAEWLRARARLEGTAGGGRRIFVSRADAAWRRIANEDEVYALLQGHGFELVKCAEMNVAEQIAAFGQAEMIVGTHGAGLTNLLFCPRGARVVEIFASAAAQDISNYRVLASHLELSYSRLLASSLGTPSRKSPHDQDMVVDPNRLEQLLSAIGA